jgi:hypothetical protein
MLARTEEMVHGRRTQGEKHLQNKERRRTLARSRVFLVMSTTTMLHSVHERKQQASSAEMDEVASRLQTEFLLVSTLFGIFSNSGT